MAAAFVVGFVDLLRPPDQRTHIGRFFSQVGREGFTGLFKVLHRKLDANLASFSTARLIWVLPIVCAAPCLHLGVGSHRGLPPSGP